jgi:molecular chaperone HtpG
MLDNEPEKYLTFFKEFGKILKEGIHTDHTNQEKIKELAIYETMNGEPGKMISLKQYITQMPATQNHIYYITGESRDAVNNSPALEIFRQKGYDVIFMTDPIDEWVMQSMQQFDKKLFKSATKGDLDLDADSNKAAENTIKVAAEKHKTLVEFLQKSLEKEIKEVRFTSRLTESACCLVADEHAMSSHIERMFKAMNQAMPSSKRILELNPAHPLVDAMQQLYDKEPENAMLKDYAGLLYDQALLTEGSPIADPLEFSKRVARLMVSNLVTGK